MLTDFFLAEDEEEEGESSAVFEAAEAEEASPWPDSREVSPLQEERRTEPEIEDDIDEKQLRM